MRAAVALAVIVVVAEPALAAKRAPQVERGREIARRTCASCHAVEVRGASPVPKAAPFASREMQHVAGLEGRLAALTTAGHHGMPPQPLSPEDIGALLAYIESLGPSAASR